IQAAGQVLLQEFLASLPPGSSTNVTVVNTTTGAVMQNLVFDANGNSVDVPVEDILILDGPSIALMLGSNNATISSDGKYIVGAGGTVGVVRGVNRTIGRTVVGAVEVLSFPIPSEPYIKPDSKVYPDSYKPGGLGKSTTLATDNSLGFESSDVAPLIPGSRFRVID
ncbi:MAG: hypothetical protein ACKPAH_04270, partial [Verrucomicrobiota bacterium]